MKCKRYAGPALLWELERAAATDIHLRYLDPAGAPRDPPAARGDYPGRWDAKWPGIEFFNASGFYDPADRDIVEASFSLGGSPRRLLYVQHDATDPASAPPLLSRFIRGGLDAILEKATLELAQEPGYQRTFDQALDHLARGRGRILTDIGTRASDKRLSLVSRIERWGYARAEGPIILRRRAKADRKAQLRGWVRDLAHGRPPRRTRN